MQAKINNDTLVYCNRVTVDHDYTSAIEFNRNQAQAHS